MPQEQTCIEKPYINDDFFGEIEEVHRCLQAKLIESPRMSLQDSIDCVDLIEKITFEFSKSNDFFLRGEVFF